MNNDLISRKWLTDAIRNRRTYLSYEDAKDVIALINNAPTVDIKDQIAGAYNEGYVCGNKEAEKTRPQGEWTAREDMDFLDENKVIHNHFMCEKCGFIHDFIDGHTSQYNFCPECGTKMKGGAE